LLAGELALNPPELERILHELACYSFSTSCIFKMRLVP
jgi:hypothetical protein